MKTRETKAKDLAALTDSLAASSSAMVVSFSKLSVTKDQEFRNSLREAGAEYQVVKNTLARIAVKGTKFEEASEHFKGVTAIAWTKNDPVILSKAISKFMKDNAEVYTFKAGVVDGRLIDLAQLTTIASLPSKEELISKLMWVLNSGAQRLVTVINAVPRDLAIVIKQIGEKEDRVAAAPVAAASTEEAKAEEAVAPAAEEEAPAEEAAEPTEETPAEQPSETHAATSTEAESEAASAAPDDKAAEAAGTATEAQSPDDKAEEVLEKPASPEDEA
ncbi:MAG: 50S ribosomal protein L10 [Pyrinomonadaceae bacterium]